MRPQCSWQFSSNRWKHGDAKCRLHCVDYNCFGDNKSNLTFIFDLNYFLWKVKTSKRQGVSSLLETKHKVFRFLEDQSKTLKVASKLLSPTLNRIGDRLVVISEPRKIRRVFVFKFWGLRGLWGLWGLRGLCFQDTPYHLTSNRNFRIFSPNGKHPIYTLYFLSGVTQ